MNFDYLYQDISTNSWMQNPPATAGVDVCRMYDMIGVRGIANETLIIGDFVLWMVH